MIDVTESVKTFMDYFELNMPVNAEIEFNVADGTDQLLREPSEAHVMDAVPYSQGNRKLHLVVFCVHRGQKCTQRISMEKIQTCRSPEDLAAVHADAFKTRFLDMETRPAEDVDEDDDD